MRTFIKAQRMHPTSTDYPVGTIVTLIATEDSCMILEDAEGNQEVHENDTLTTDFDEIFPEHDFF